MKFNEVMHLSFYTDQMDKMRDFYENKLGLKAKIIMRYGAYLGQKSRGAWAKKAITDPDGIAYIFIELAPGQYLALMVDDIFEARKELIEAGIEIDIEPNKGQSETWQMWIHDPDGNKFEIMQYTDLSLQHQGNVG